MSALHLQRDDGPLARRAARSHLPVPRVPGLVVAIVVGLGPGVVEAVGRAAGPTGIAEEVVGPSWAWTMGAVLLALIAVAGRSTPRLAWSAPGLLRILEYGAVVVLVGGSPSAYALLSVLAFHHYDIVYRARLRRPPSPAWLAQAGGGWELRTLAVTVAVALGAGGILALVLAAWLAMLYVPDAVRSWVSPRADPRRPRRRTGQPRP